MSATCTGGLCSTPRVHTLSRGVFFFYDISCPSRSTKLSLARCTLFFQLKLPVFTTRCQIKRTMRTLLPNKEKPELNPHTLIHSRFT
ncbi:hypothetical protein PSHT_10888 [Puccinia striiformis]|uniref:Uncharacterized protein n=1 Tax=Puccinia striiformis TaxID=27350 RepID=A0A2S4V6W8_9BASI|nr:hypothetical protein PSHT_10888 [Puccinia striiformis]